MVDPDRWLFGALLALLALALADTPDAHASDIQTRTEVRALRTLGKNAQATALELSADLKHKNLPGKRSMYSTVTRAVPVTRVRNLAVKSVARGRIHPAMIAATVAAGLIIDNDTGEILSESDPEQVPVGNMTSVPGSETQFIEPLDSSASSLSVSYTREEAHERFLDVYAKGLPFHMCYGKNHCHELKCPAGSSGVFDPEAEEVGCLDQQNVPDKVQRPATDEELEKLDEPIADRSKQLVPWIAEDPQGEWKKNTDADPRIESDEGIPEPLRRAAKKDADNITADEKGEERPHPDQETEPETAEDEILDEMDGGDGDSLSFPEKPEPEWNVNMYGPDDLEEKDVNVAPAQCPEPYSFTLNVGGIVQEEITIPYTEICTFAERVNPFFLAGAWVLAGFIVIRR
ncbi:hypothetical protein CK501_15950 [Halovibrio salipaludis]|uniref:TspB protein n=1 Tax=Halovibrio salipaludis TaxID=2032626 RepID=A0A2A2EUT1_9GAMM|nr:virulence factor TspB C-terminal domain-related protein [Halovibrio salipaludis]PAU76428.1 hypothetical protein CK501_15950 [Halovibrio salipaludis]